MADADRQCRLCNATGDHAELFPVPCVFSQEVRQSAQGVVSNDEMDEEAVNNVEISSCAGCLLEIARQGLLRFDFDRAMEISVSEAAIQTGGRGKGAPLADKTVGKKIWSSPYSMAGRGGSEGGSIATTLAGFDTEEDVFEEEAQKSTMLDKEDLECIMEMSVCLQDMPAKTPKSPTSAVASTHSPTQTPSARSVKDGTSGGIHARWDLEMTRMKDGTLVDLRHLSLGEGPGSAGSAGSPGNRVVAESAAQSGQKFARDKAWRRTTDDDPALLERKSGFLKRNLNMLTLMKNSTFSSFNGSWFRLAHESSSSESRVPSLPVRRDESTCRGRSDQRREDTSPVY